MKNNIVRALAFLTVLTMIVTGCGGAATPAAAPAPTQAPAPAPTAAPAAAPTEAPAAATGAVVEAKPGADISMVLLPKFMGQQGLRRGPRWRPGSSQRAPEPGQAGLSRATADNSVAGQIEIVTNATTQGVKAIMISNNAGDQLGPVSPGSPRQGA